VHPVMAAGFDSAYPPAEETASAIRGMEISASELLEIVLQRIDRQNPKINAVIWQFRERAAARARDADKALAKTGPWDGSPGPPMDLAVTGPCDEIRRRICH
jgi:amidase